MLNQKEEKIMQLIRMAGPTLPSVAAKSIDTEVYLAAAILSGLVQNNHLKISHLRVGSSPLYFIEGQESKVRERLHKELNDLEKKALERMKELKVAFPNDLYPQERVLLNEIKDFVEHLKIKIGEEELDVWKHYSVNDDELNRMIEEKLKPKTEIQEEKPAPETVVQEEIKDAEKQEPESVANEEKPKKKRSQARTASDFEKKIDDYLKEKGIEIILTKQISKGESMHDVILETPLGPQNFLIKIKKKSSIGESDISTFYAECMHHKKPGILFVPKAMNKKTKDFVSKHIGGLVKVIVI